MADNVTLPGTGAVVASDDIGGVQYQRVKLVDGTLDSSVAVKATAAGELLVSSAAFSMDAGGRERVSQMTTLFDGKTLGADDTNIYENVGTGTGTWASNKFSMSVTSGQYYIRRGKHVTPYFSGKAQLVECTFDGFQAEANTTKMVGYYSSSAVSPYNTSYDGFWLENDGTTVRLKASRNGTSTLDVAWTSWDNYAAVAGYDWSKFTVIAFDFLWLGGATLRLFLKTDNGFIHCHTMKWSANNTDVFILNPNQSVRYELRSSTGSGSFRPICAQVASEGSTGEAGKTLAIYNSTALATNTVGTIYALKGLKKTATHRYTQVVVTSVCVGNIGTADAGFLMVILNPTLSASLTYANNSRISEATATNQTVTAGTGRVLYITPSGTVGGAAGLNDNFLAQVGMTVADVSDEIILAYMPTTATQSVFGAITVKEV